MYLVKARNERPGVLLPVADATLISTGKTLLIPLFRTKLEPIFLLMLYGNQDSHSMYLKLVRELPSILSSLRKEGMSTVVTWGKLAEASR